MPSGMALEDADTVEVIAAYSAPKTVIPSVATTPGWVVVGEFPLPKSVSARLDANILVSAPGLTLRVRLYDMEDGAVSGATAQTTAQTSTRVLSGIVALQGGRSYQIQAECTGGTGDSNFGVVSSATISD